MPENKYPIIAHGESYIEPLVNQPGAGSKSYPHEYSQNVNNMLLNIEKIYDSISKKREVFLSEKIVCIRLEPKFEAKSYVPNSLLTLKDDMSIVGGRKYSINSDNKDHTAKLYFMKTTDKGIHSLYTTLKNDENSDNTNWVNQIRSIHSIDLLDPSEKIMGFPSDWLEGKLEIILHPLLDENKRMLSLFYELSGLDENNKTKIRSYSEGLTFISATLSRKNIENLKNFNPLRAIHPLGNINIPPIRSSLEEDAPTVSKSNKKSQIVVGVFDGGVDSSIPLLNGYVNPYDCVPTNDIPEYKAHGTGVCGTILHGELSGKTKNDVLPIPSLSVNSYRVLPLQDATDIDLYEAIDVIENTVKTNRDIKLFNISFGPSGPILDDTINRFTYVLDKLTYEIKDDEINPLFCIAVGNDGELVAPLNRIQSPSDMVNGLGIGAYTKGLNNKKIKVSYSCVGEGREGAKVKPDLLDFGGSRDRPFVIVNTKHNKLTVSAGTSFAAPLITRKIGMLMAKSENIVPHLGRILLIHNAQTNSDFSQEEQGYGFCLEDIDDLLTCNDNKVTLLYSGNINPRRAIKLPIFAPEIDAMKGKVKISWTIAAIVNPDVNDPDAYTHNCIVDTFIPHNYHYRFLKGKKGQNLYINKPDDLLLSKELEAQGYKKSSYPISKSSKKNWDESDLRKNDLKWDTVINGSKNMYCSSLCEPYIKLQSISRNDSNLQEFKFFVVVTIEANNYKGSLYDTILQTYQNLSPIEIRDVNRIMVDIT
ncbi:hypothetical protein FACS189450_11900 [Spirochaetia bacterium]|nr:hypothetical protein FACS189450_11900 [Spirochaetia bacterium]